MVVDFSKSGFLYFIQQGDKDIFKVGIAQHNPLKRLAQLQTGSSDKLRLVGFVHELDVRDAEIQIHAFLKESRLEGEWFMCDPQAVRNYLKDSSRNACHNAFRKQENRLAYYLTLLEMKLWHFGDEVKGKLSLLSIFNKDNKINTDLYFTTEEIVNTKQLSIPLGFCTSFESGSIDDSAMLVVKNLLRDFSQFDVHYKILENSLYPRFFFVRNTQDKIDISNFDSLSIDEKINMLKKNMPVVYNMGNRS